MLAFQRYDRYILDKNEPSKDDDEPNSSEELFNLFHGEDNYDKRQLKALKNHLQKIDDRSKLDIEDKQTLTVHKLLKGIFGRNSST